VACKDVFTVSANGAARKTPRPTEDGDIAPKPALLKKVLRDPTAALEGAIPGAVSGVLSGVAGAILAGIFSGQATGEVVARALLGFIIGFAVGTFLGAILATAVKRLQPDFRIQPGVAALLGGAMIGAAVVTIVEDFRWIPLGVGIGAAAADLWLRLCKRVEVGAPTPSREIPELDTPAAAERHTIPSGTEAWGE
jgi:MFS family permease